MSEREEFAIAVNRLRLALDRADASVGHRLADDASFGSGIKAGDIRKCIAATEQLLAVPVTP